MRASPAFQVSIERFGVWRSGVWTITALGAATLGAWLLTAAPPTPLMQPTSRWRFAAVMTAWALMAGIAWSLCRVRAASLSWDGRQWSLARLAAHGEGPGGGPVLGDMQIAIDLGPWLLLRFVPADAAGRSRPSWLPVQRLGLEPHWHALRCAVHAPRPLPAADPGADAGPSAPS